MNPELKRLMPKVLRIAAEKLRVLTDSPDDWVDLGILADWLEGGCGFTREGAADLRYCVEIAAEHPNADMSVVYMAFSAIEKIEALLPPEEASDGP